MCVFACVCVCVCVNRTDVLAYVGIPNYISICLSLSPFLSLFFSLSLFLYLFFSPFLSVKKTENVHLCVRMS